VTKSPAFGYQDIWSIVDGEVVQDEAIMEEVIHSRNIYVPNPAQEELGRAVIEYIRLSNYIDGQFKKIPWRLFPAPPWSLVGRSAVPNLAMLSLEVEQLRLILSNIQE
jgi:hypothetical protein